MVTGNRDPTKRIKCVDGLSLRHVKSLDLVLSGLNSGARFLKVGPLQGEVSQIERVDKWKRRGKSTLSEAKRGEEGRRQNSLK